MGERGTGARGSKADRERQTRSVGLGERWSTDGIERRKKKG